ncbi:unnamed protein product [Amoebophrya sp. A120]|nr:unnamed protein product [Amoebophrya sp. A120]|eukprot:GSA120T00002275001.1
MDLVVWFRFLCFFSNLWSLFGGEFQCLTSLLPPDSINLNRGFLPGAAALQLGRKRAQLMMNGLSAEVTNSIADGITQGGNALLTTVGFDAGTQNAAMMAATGAVSVTALANSVSAYQTMQIAASLRTQNNLIEQGNRDRHRAANAAEQEVALVESRERASEILDTLSGLILENLPVRRTWTANKPQTQTNDKDDEVSSARNAVRGGASTEERHSSTADERPAAPKVEAHVFVHSSNLRLRCLHSLEKARRNGKSDGHHFPPELLQGRVHFYPLERYDEVIRDLQQSGEAHRVLFGEDELAKNTNQAGALPEDGPGSNFPVTTMQAKEKQQEKLTIVYVAPPPMQPACSAPDPHAGGSSGLTVTSCGRRAKEPCDHASGVREPDTCPLFTAKLCSSGSPFFPAIKDTNLVVYVDSQTPFGRRSTPSFVYFRPSADFPRIKPLIGGLGAGTTSRSGEKQARPAADCSLAVESASANSAVPLLRRFENAHFCVEAPDVASWKTGECLQEFRSTAARSGVSLDGSCRLQCVLPPVHVPDVRCLDEEVTSCERVLRYRWDWAPVLVNALGNGMARVWQACAACGATTNDSCSPKSAGTVWTEAFVVLQTKNGEYYVVDFADARKSDGTKGIQILGPYQDAEEAILFQDEAKEALTWTDLGQMCWYFMSPVTCPFYGPWVDRTVGLGDDTEQGIKTKPEAEVRTASDSDSTATAQVREHADADQSAQLGGACLTLRDLVTQMQNCEIKGETAPNETSNTFVHKLEKSLEQWRADSSKPSVVSRPLS